MKIVISHFLLNASQDVSSQILAAFGVHHTPETAETFPTVTDRANFSVRHVKDVDGAPLVEISIADHVIVKAMGLYVKIARFVGPIFHAIREFMPTLKQDVNEVERLMHEEIDPEVLDPEVLDFEAGHP